ncbi:MAG TPA: CBASS cGAMP-activated phospholipase [Bryobacteraceae bacterium]|nr:CBASS cGAMP-activated phospholipase [Bryobacteraceae bacterium]
MQSLSLARPQSLAPSPAPPLRILSIDGGGIRGIVPALVLSRIEKLTNRPVAKLFDLVAGTSTGGILALGLTVPKFPGRPLYTAQQLVAMFEREGPRIFSRSFGRRLVTSDSLVWKKYSSKGIDQVLFEYFDDAKLSDAATDVLIPSYEIARRFPFFFKSASARKRPDYDFRARDIARATSAAPSYFEPMRIPTGTNSDFYTLIDGGVFANNPAACALVEAQCTLPHPGGYLIVSLGTGSLIQTVPVGPARNWGCLQWAKPLLNAMFDGVSSTVDFQLRQLMPTGYYRFQPALNPANHGLDNTNRSNLAALKALANKMIEEKSAELDTLCEQLTLSGRSQKPEARNR